MKNKDYTKYSNDNTNANTNTPVDQVISTDNTLVDQVISTDNTPVDQVIPTDNAPTEENQNEPTTDNLGQCTFKQALVAKCTKLNVRKEPSKNAPVICVIAKDNEITVNIDESTDDFYKIYTESKDVLVEGYCVKEFISIVE